MAGAFTAALEQALLDEAVDLAVHSLKDLPIDPAPGLELAAILPRGRADDALLIRPDAHAPDRDLPLVEGARVATSGPRRRSQLLARDETLVPVDIRGNVDTRLEKLKAGWFDALVMAHVAIERAPLDTTGVTVHPLDLDANPCAPGQAAIAVQARKGSPAASIAHRLDDPPTRAAVEAERDLLDALGGGCGLPLGAWAHASNGTWQLSATFAGTGWTPGHAPTVRRVHLTGDAPASLAKGAADELQATEPTPRRPGELGERPAGPPVLVVASEPTALAYAARLRSSGHAAVPIPTRTFEPRPAPKGEERARLRDVDWIVATSRQAAGPLGQLVGEEPPDAYVATVGPATARALHAHGVPVHLVAPDGTAEDLAHELVRLDPEPGRVLFAQGDTALDTAERILQDAGAETLPWTAYTTSTQPVDLAKLDVELPARTAIVMSPNNARALPLSTPHRIAERFVAFGPSTAETLREHGIEPILPPAPRPDALLEVLP